MRVGGFSFASVFAAWLGQGRARHFRPVYALLLAYNSEKPISHYIRQGRTTQ